MINLHYVPNPNLLMSRQDCPSMRSSTLDCSIWHSFCLFYYSRVCSDHIRCHRRKLQIFVIRLTVGKQAKRMPDITVETTTDYWSFKSSDWWEGARGEAPPSRQIRRILSALTNWAFAKGFHCTKRARNMGPRYMSRTKLGQIRIVICFGCTKILCISTSERMLAHAFTWLKTMKNTWKLPKKYFFSSYTRETHVRLIKEHESHFKVLHSKTKGFTPNNLLEEKTVIETSKSQSW